MLQIKDLTITHRKDLRVMLQDFSCVLNAGDKAVVIGEEGNGKSTLLKWIYDPETVAEYTEAEGERVTDERRIAYLPQELPESERAKTVCAFFMDEPEFLEKNPRELGKMADDFGLSSDFFWSQQTMGTLSGGEKVKAQMMRLLMTDPSVLLLDEPSNDIDIETLEWLEALITDWEGIVLFISHDETLIERTANTVIHLEQIRRKTLSRFSIARMPYAQYKAERLAAFEKQEQQALSERREKKIRDEKIHKMEQSVGSKLTNISKADRDAVGRLLKKKMKAVKSMQHRFEREDAQMTQMPEEEEAIFFKLGSKDAAVPAGKTVLDLSLDTLQTPDGARVLSENVHMKIRGARKVCIIGKNGAGKTTLLRKIAQTLLARDDIRAEYMPQNYEELLDLDKTPVDYLDSSGDKQERSRIRTYLGALKYTADEMDHPIAQLSGGQKAKVLLLKMSLSDADVLILDEPTRNFSPLSGPVIRRMLSQFPGAIISVSHDRKYIGEVCDEVYILSENGLVRSAGRR